MSAVVGQLKGASAHALNQLRPGSIHWQAGYGVVTFRRTELAKVVSYVDHQEEHHRTGALSPLLEPRQDPEPSSDQNPHERRP